MIYFKKDKQKIDKYINDKKKENIKN